MRGACLLFQFVRGDFMSVMSRCLAGVLLVLSIAVVTAHAAGPKDPALALSSVLLRTSQDWTEGKYRTYPEGLPELTVVKMHIPPNTTLPWYSHPMPNIAYVMAGSLTVETRDGKHRKVLKTGDVLPGTVGVVYRDVTGVQAADLMVFYAGTVGLPGVERPKVDGKPATR